jgi:threonyl-tRNA synthetase
MDKASILEQKRHSLEHVMVLATKRLYGENFCRLGVGPVIENGFYQDFDYKIQESDLENIEKEMAKVISEGLDFVREEISIDEAIAYFKSLKQDFKVELLEDIKSKGSSKVVGEESASVADLTKNGMVSLYSVGIHKDLCRGPHVSNTDELSDMIFKLDRLAGAYWRGNEKNPMLSRVYAIAFETQAEFDKYYSDLEEARRRDHKVLGQKLDLFVFSDLVGKMPLYTPRGQTVLSEMVKFSQSLNKKIGYKEVWTPQINRAELFKVSGHYDTYKQDMMRVISQYEDEEYFLKPMNCPQHTQIFASQVRSYRDMPIRIADFANLYRDERPGSLNGLLRLRYFRQDDGHAFCMPEQIEQEIRNILGVVQEAANTYGLSDYWVRLSLRDPEKKSEYIGSDEVWENAEKTLQNIAENLGVNYKIGIGEAAIYGPKLDFMTKDALGREWQTSTIQLDFNMPGRFGLKYIDKDGQDKTPIMIHRAITGGIERLFGILIEHYAGAFPLWLSPVQVIIVPVSNDKHGDYAKNVQQALFDNDIRVEIYDENETLGNRIRKAKEMKVNYIVVVGDKEIESGNLNIRNRKDEQESYSLGDFIQKAQEEIVSKSI